MKLYEVTIQDDMDVFSYLMVSNKSKSDLELEIEESNVYCCFMWCRVEEVDEVDGYKISLKKINKEN